MIKIFLSCHDLCVVAVNECLKAACKDLQAAFISNEGEGLLE